jgi:hypothetical protein
VTGQIGDRTYAFIGLERIGGIVVFDVTDPFAPTFETYFNTRTWGRDTKGSGLGDLGPEGLAFITAEDSPNGKPLLVVAHEVSGSTTVFQVVVTPVDRLPQAPLGLAVAAARLAIPPDAQPAADAISLASRLKTNAVSPVEPKLALDLNSVAPNEAADFTLERRFSARGKRTDTDLFGVALDEEVLEHVAMDIVYCVALSTYGRR